MAEAVPVKNDELTHELLSRGLCVSACGRVLLCRLVSARHRSFLPGGHVDPGEGARAALVREIREELGVVSRAGAFLGAAEHFFGPPGGLTFEMNVVFALECPALSAAPAAAGGGPGIPPDPPSAEPWQEFFWWPADRLAEVGFEPACLRGTVAEWVSAMRGGSAAAPVFASAYEKTTEETIR